MHIIKTSEILQKQLNAIRSDRPNVTLGLVPTMGALHEGHISLIQSSVAENEITVCSIFVNPTQFGEAADLDNYPKPIEKDIELLVKHECTILFLPSYSEVYPPSYAQQIYDLDDIDNKIEGASRPGHFQGVCNVLDRLFTIILPTHAYFGQKDYQQTVVVKKLIELTKSEITIRVVPIKREENGLAMSSRNIRLSTKGRQNAAFIYKALRDAKKDVNEMELDKLVERAKQFINAQKGAKVDYLVAVNATTLDHVESVKTETDVVLLTVVEYEGVRLLDNLYLKKND